MNKLFRIYLKLFMVLGLLLSLPATGLAQQAAEGCVQDCVIQQGEFPGRIPECQGWIGEARLSLSQDKGLALVCPARLA